MLLLASRPEGRFIVYAADFEMAGAPAAMTGAWKKTKTVINVDDPTPLGKCLGCNRTMCDVPASWVDNRPYVRCSEMGRTT
jgi:hypothetical protein